MILLYATDSEHKWESTAEASEKWEEEANDYYDSLKNSLEMYGAKKPFTMTVLEIEE